MTEENNKVNTPRLLVYSILFPTSAQPNSGLFIRERLFRVGKQVPIVVVSPRPWFPFQSFIRLFLPDYRIPSKRMEIQNGIDIYFPRFFAIPGLFRRFDGFSMAVCSMWTVLKLKKKFNFNIIDAHFAYPDGYAAGLLGRWLKVPVTITLRGTEVPLAKTDRLPKMLTSLTRAKKIFSVATALKTHVVNLGIDGEKVQVVGNGIDTKKFFPLNKKEARNLLTLDGCSPVIITVGGLVERKGFHRVIHCLPELIKNHPKLLYLIVGGASAEGNIESKLRELVCKLKMENHVKFLGPIAPEKLHQVLSAADVFVLATSNEGWANVFLEAMACGLPVVTTDVGGNCEVVCDEKLGIIVPFGNEDSLQKAIDTAVRKNWNREYIIEHAKQNSWENRVDVLLSEYNKIVNNHTKMLRLNTA